MNPFLNPKITMPFIKNYFLEPGRIQRMNSKQIKQYRTKALRKMVSYAYTVPVYRKKYKEAGITPKDIKKIEDIKKLPFISRTDLKEVFPDGVVPKNFDIKKGQVICTGGTTSKYCCQSGSEPVCTYTNHSTLLRSIIISKREYNYFNLDLRKTKVAHIGNFNPYKFDEVYKENIIENAKIFFSFKNQLNMHASRNTHTFIKKLEKFNPEIIISYPSIFQDISYLKRKGYGEKIQPKLLFVGGAMLDEYTRKYVESALKCRMLNIYSSCESGANIAFECLKGNWHIHSDFFHIEAVDKDMQTVEPGERGQLVITRLYGGGTPIIRYTGMEDWVTLGGGKKCSCGLKNPIFDKPVEGRVASNIILPDGKKIPPSQFLDVANVLVELNTFKVKKFQIIQEEVDEIDIFLVIDNDLRSKEPSFEKIAKKIKKAYADKIGSKININVKETDEIKSDPKTGKPEPILISRVNYDKCDLT